MSAQIKLLTTFVAAASFQQNICDSSFNLVLNGKLNTLLGDEVVIRSSNCSLYIVL